MVTFITPKCIVEHDIIWQFAHELIQVKFLCKFSRILVCFNRAVLSFTKIQVFENSDLCESILNLIYPVPGVFAWIIIQEIIYLLLGVIPILCVKTIGLKLVWKEVEWRMFFRRLIAFTIVFHLIIFRNYLYIFHICLNLWIESISNFI